MDAHINAEKHGACSRQPAPEQQVKYPRRNSQRNNRGKLIENDTVVIRSVKAHGGIDQREHQRVSPDVYQSPVICFIWHIRWVHEIIEPGLLLIAALSYRYAVVYISGIIVTPGAVVVKAGRRHEKHRKAQKQRNYTVGADISGMHIILTRIHISSFSPS